MDRDTIIKLAREVYGENTKWEGATLEKLEHLVKLVAEHVTKSAPDYKMGYADGVAVEREAVLDLVDDYAKNNTDLRDAIRARGQS